MIRPVFWFPALLFTGAIFASACVVAAQTSGPVPATAAAPNPAAAVQPGASAAPPRPQQKPTNLKVLPENTDIRAVMHQYEADLGVHCRFCHDAPDATTHRTNFASDNNLTKNAARYMIQMTADLNGKYLAQMPMRTFGDAVTCGTCHRGNSRPPFFVAPAEAEGDRPTSAPGAATPQGAAGPTGLSR